MITSAQETKVLHHLRKLIISVSSGYMYVYPLLDYIVFLKIAVNSNMLDFLSISLLAKPNKKAWKVQHSFGLIG